MPEARLLKYYNMQCNQENQISDFQEVVANKYDGF
jgi:hypothetical protein